MSRQFIRITNLIIFTFFLILVHLTYAANNSAIENAKSAVVLIKVDENTYGAGTLLTDEGHIITAMHLLSESGRLTTKVKFQNQNQFRKATILAVDKYFDLALLKIKAKNLPPPINIGDSSNLTGKAQFHIIGPPSRGGIKEPFTVDHTTLKKIDSFGRIFLHGYLYPGNSGGPVLTSKGELVGIICHRSEFAEESYCVPINNVQIFLQSHGIYIDKGKLVNYPSEVAFVKKKLNQYELAFFYLMSDLDWKAKITINKSILENETITKKDLVIWYEYKFDGQYTPDGKCYFLVFPILSNAEFVKEKLLQKKCYLSKYDSLYGANKVVFSDFEGEIDAKIKEYNEEEKTDFRLKNVEKLIVEIQPASKSKKIRFPSKTLEIAY